MMPMQKAMLPGNKIQRVLYAKAGISFAARLGFAFNLLSACKRNGEDFHCMLHTRRFTVLTAALH